MRSKNGGSVSTPACHVSVQMCRKIRGLGCVNQARTRVRVTQPSPYIFLHICIYSTKTNVCACLVGSSGSAMRGGWQETRP